MGDRGSNNNEPLSDYDENRLYLDNSEGSLHWAAINGIADELRTILSADSSCVDVRNEDGKTALLCAAELGQTLAVKILLDSGADPLDGCHEDQICCIHAAAAGGFIDIIHLLLDVNVDIELADYHGNTALFYAVLHNHMEVVTFLIENGAEMNESNDDGVTPLQIAIDEKCAAMVRLLMEGGASIEKEGFRMNHLHLASTADDAEVMETLLEWATAEEINCQEENRSTPLHHACLIPESEVISRLLDYDVTDVKLVDAWGYTPLHHCAEAANAEGVERVIERGADLEAVDPAGNTALCLAAMQAEQCFSYGCKNISPDTHLDVVKVLLEAGAHVNHRTNISITPLLLALERGCMKVASALIGKGAEVQITDIVDRNTPLHYAAQFTNSNMVLTLVKLGAALSTKNTRDMMPLDMISGTDSESFLIFHILLVNGTDYRRHDYNIALHSYGRQNDTCFKLLLAHGAAFCEILSLFRLSSVETKWHEELGNRFGDFNSVHFLAKQQSYRKLLREIYGFERYPECDYGMLKMDGKSISLPVPTLFSLCIVWVRENLLLSQQGKSIWRSVKNLKVPSSIKDSLLIVDLDETGFLKQLRRKDGQLIVTGS